MEKLTNEIIPSVSKEEMDRELQLMQEALKESDQGIEQSKDDIPDAEKNDDGNPLINNEEMAHELKIMQGINPDDFEDKIESKLEIIEDQKYIDAERMKEIRKQLKEMSDKKTPEQRLRDEAKIIEEMKEAMKPSPKTNADSQGKSDIIPPQEIEPGDNGDEGNPDHNFVTLHTGQADIKQEICQVCHGTGRKFFILPCYKCGGRGTETVYKGWNWKDKKIKRTGPVAYINDTPEQKE